MIFATKIKAFIYYLNRFLDQTQDKCRDILIKSQIILRYHKRGDSVLIGSVMSNLGGVPHHIHEIVRRSKYKPYVLPHPSLLNRILKWNKTSLFLNYSERYQSRLKFRIFHSHVDPWFINICRNARENGAKWVHTYHTLYFDKDWDNGLEAWQQEINKALTKVALMADVRISVSKWLKQYLTVKYGIDTIYIPNGVDVEKCDKADPGRFFKSYPYRDFVLFASGISDVKNPVDFIRLANAISHKTFVMIGRQLSVEALMNKYKIEIPPNLIVINQMPHEELLDAIAACKVFVVTSRSEGLPTVLMEAMALQRTVVGCDTYGTKEVIGSEEFGYIYDHTSFEELVRKTQMAMNDSEKGPRARNRILENYDWRVIIPRIDEIYSNLLNAKD